MLHKTEVRKEEKRKKVNVQTINGHYVVKRA